MTGVDPEPLFRIRHGGKRPSLLVDRREDSTIRRRRRYADLMATFVAEKPMDRKLFSDIEETHGHEEKLRRESMALIEADPELSRRLEMVQKAMALIFGYTIEHTSRSEDETTVQLLGIRLFNAAASGIKLALSGYYQTAFHQARDIMETGYLLDYFRTSPTQRAVWKQGDSRTRRKLFDPVIIRIAWTNGTETPRRSDKPNTTSSRSWHHMRRSEDFNSRCAAGLPNSGRSSRR